MTPQEEAIAKAIHGRLTQARRPLLVAHRRPDGDTLGSVLAAYGWLRDLGRKATVFCDDAVPGAYAHLPGARAVTSDRAVFRDPEVDLLCSIDVGDLQMTGAPEDFAGLSERVHCINIDHHVTNTRFGHENLVISGASSAAEIVHDLLRANGVVPTRAMAECLMTGLINDTSCFSNSATTAGSLRAAAGLLLRGASFPDITRRLRCNKPIQALKLWGVALERLRLDPATGIASTALTLDDLKGIQVEDDALGGISNFVCHLLDAPVVLVFRELPGGKVVGSYRSNSEVDVAALAQARGGGGHKKAAGFSVEGRLVETERGWEVAPAAPMG